MRKVALVFTLAVFVPSLVLAWLAVRSLRDQQFVLERQRSLLYQNVVDALARDAENSVLGHQHEFASQVETILAGGNPADIAPAFDQRLRTNWPLAEIGFVVAMSGVSCNLISPSPYGGPAARNFYANNGTFLANRESAEVYWSPGRAPVMSDTANNPAWDNGNRLRSGQTRKNSTPEPAPGNGLEKQNYQSAPAATLDSNQADNAAAQRFSNQNLALDSFGANNYLNTKQSYRRVYPQQQSLAAAAANNQAGNFGEFDNQVAQQKIQAPKDESRPPSASAPATRQPPEPIPAAELSKVASAEAEFQQLIGDSTEGTLARFVGSKLNVMFWYRSPRDPRYVFGAQLALPRLIEELRGLIQNIDAPLREEICIALLDDNAKPAALSDAAFEGNWKHPFVSTEIGEELPHWEMAAYLLHPDRLTQSAQTLKLTLGLLIALLVLAIGTGSWLIVSDLNRQLTLARQKTDFVSNVSHELKTPLTSIRMFSELLAEQRVTDPAKQRSYLNIITAETARLTRLVSNVLDFSRLERGEKKYNLRDCDFVDIVRETVETYRPHLENNGFALACSLPANPLPVHADSDAVAQVIVNLLSNAEKYSGDRKEITIEVGEREGPLPCAEARVLDRGLGVPRNAEEKIFEMFYRAHDSLSSGIQGSGLGLTLARQIARAQGGEVAYEPRAGGGSCFMLRLPLKRN